MADRSVLASVSARTRRRRDRRRRVIAAVVGVAVVGAGGGVAIAATSGDDSKLVLGDVTTGSVTQTVQASGTVGASSSTTASFATNGTVSAVNAVVGQTVAKGQALAQLNTTSLQSAVDSATAAVASAQQRLENDKTGQTNSSGSTANSSLSTNALAATPITASASSTPIATSSVSPTVASTPSSSPSGSTTTGLTSQIKAGQEQVIAAQKALDTAHAAVVAAQQVVTAGVLQNTQLSQAAATACGTSGSGAGSSDCISAMADYTAYATTIAAAGATLKQAVDDETDALTALDTAISKLDGLLARLSVSTGSTPTGSTPTGSSSNKTSSSSAAANSSAKAQSSQPASASQLAADQAAIDAAEAQLTVAQQNLAAATLTAPVAGVIASVGYVAGASSNSKSITILGTSNQVVKINVPLSQINQLKVGQTATMTIDGQAKPYTGKVTKIGLLSSTSGSSTTFPVTVTFDDGSAAVHDGLGAEVTITTGSATNATLVPNSAITSIGTSHTVTVVANGKPKTAQVTVGVVGTDVTQIKSGLNAGDKVELADASQALPGSATSGTTTTGRIGNVQFPAGGNGPVFSRGGN